LPRWRRNSIYGDGPRTPLDCNARARFEFLVRAYRRARRITQAAEKVAKALLRHLGESGRCDPSYETLAKHADCEERTVGRCLADLRDLGLIRWQRRKDQTPEGARQISNAYELLTTATDSPTRRGPKGQNVRATLKGLIPPLLSPPQINWALEERRAFDSRAEQLRVLGFGT
jgi:hypothetical protein